MAVNVKQEPAINVKEEHVRRSASFARPSIVIHPTAVSAYMLEMAVHNVQKCMAATGRVLCADKVGVLLCNLRLLSKTPRRMSRTIDAPTNMEFYDSTSVRGITGAMETAMVLLPYTPEADEVLRLLGRFSSVEDCAVAPKGTRSQIEALIKTFTTMHKIAK
jgi:hypothetical protein